MFGWKGALSPEQMAQTAAAVERSERTKLSVAGWVTERTLPIDGGGTWAR
jgi:hypothetical protein